ncbi:hemerythrin domain-containing protein [Streptomyces sp. NPDC005423]|uniref:hemerythrin domain-containing protein n=1 Tax=Streptomyces sp. NPDC005423 TaxID=3155343 RepID=UPI0033B833F4
MTTSIADQHAAALGGGGSILVRQRRDHAELDRLMNRFLAADTRQPERDAAWQDIVQLVFSHAFAEEAVLWPVLRRISSDGEQLTGQVEEEHQAINELVARIEKTSPDDSRHVEWTEQAFSLIREDIRDEEDALLPRMREALSDRQLRLVGAVWEAVRISAPTHPHPGVSRRPPGNALSGLPLSAFDRLRDLAPFASPRARRVGVAVTGVLAAAGTFVLVLRAARRGATG